MTFFFEVVPKSHKWSQVDLYHVLYLPETNDWPLHSPKTVPVTAKFIFMQGFLIPGHPYLDLTRHWWSDCYLWTPAPARSEGAGMSPLFTTGKQTGISGYYWTGLNTGLGLVQVYVDWRIHDHLWKEALLKGCLCMIPFGDDGAKGHNFLSLAYICTRAQNHFPFFLRLP